MPESAPSAMISPGEGVPSASTTATTATMPMPAIQTAGSVSKAIAPPNATTATNVTATGA